MRRLRDRKQAITGPNNALITHTQSLHISASQLYQKISIRENPRNIRILHLHPRRSNGTTEILEGTLEVLTLPRMESGARTGSTYTALSYVWGTQEDARSQYTITCNGCAIQITRNCFNALLKVRDLHGSIAIWVDSICICQTNLEERNHQVNLMREVYSRASVVFAWLDFGLVKCDGYEAGMKFFEMLSSLSSQKSEVVPNFYGVKEFLDHEWFTRGWTFQELLLAQDVVFLTQTRVLHWYDVCRGVRRLEHRWKRLEKSSMPTDYLDPPRTIYGLIALVNTWNSISTSNRGEYGVVALIFDLSTWAFFYGVSTTLACKHKLLSDGTSSDFHTVRLAIAIGATFSQAFSASLHRPLRIGTNIQLAPMIGSRRNMVSTCERFIGCSFTLISLFELLHSMAQNTIVRSEVYHMYWAMSLLACIYASFAWYRQFVVAIGDIASVSRILTRYSSEESFWRRYLRLIDTFPKGWQAGSAGIQQALRARRVTHVKDKAYSMYGVLQAFGVHVTPPDYLKSKEDIFTEFFKDLLKWRPLMLALLADAGQTTTTENSHMPSWVPSWQTPAPSSWIPTGVLYTTMGGVSLRRVRACGFPIFSIDGKILTVWSRKLDTVTSCYQFPDKPSTMLDQDLFYDICQWVTISSNSSPQEVRQSIEHRLAALFSIVLIDHKTLAAYKSDRIYASVFKELVDCMRNGMLLRLEKDTPMCNPAEYMRDNLQAPEFRKLSTFFVEFLQRVCGRRLAFATRSGRFGSGSLNIKSGDEVHFVSGVPVPLCLRKRESQRGYKVVGPAMMDERGNGEIWKGRFEPLELF